MISKKILINGAEAYLQSNKNPLGEVSIDWINTSIYRRINLVRINHDFISDVMRYDYLLIQKEVIALNGFDYLVEEPNYSLLNSKEISTTRNQSEVAIPDASFQAPSPLSPVTAVSLFPINDAWKHHFKENAQENIIDFQTGQFRQPFYSEVSTANETAADANDGTINVQNAWGGDTALEYSIDDGANWQVSEVFNSLAPDIYLVKVKDGNGDESISKEIEILAFVE